MAPRPRPRRRAARPLRAARVPDDGDDPYGGGAGEEPYGGPPLEPGDGADCGGTAEDTSGEGTAGGATDSGESADGGDGEGTGASSSSGSTSNGEGDDTGTGGAVASAGDVSGVTSVKLARTGFDAWILAVVGAVFVAAGGAVLLARRRGAASGD